VARRAQGDLGSSLGAARALSPGGRAAVAAGLVVSGILVWLALRRVDLGIAWDAFGRVRWWVLPPALAVLAVGVFLRAVRWVAMFDPESRPPLAPALRATLVGLLFNAVLPLRLGEAVRIVMLTRETGNPPAEVVGTAAAERVYDVVVLLVLLLAAAPFLPHVSWLGAAVVLAAVLVAALAVLVVVLARWNDRPIVALLRVLPLVSTERAERIASMLVRGLAGFRDPRIALRAFLLTAASWLVLELSAWLLLDGFDYGLGFRAALLVIVATNLVLVIPSGPAAVGSFEAAVLVALSAFGIDSSRALSFAVLLHAENLLPVLVAGYLALHNHSVATRRDVAAPSRARASTANATAAATTSRPTQAAERGTPTSL
jgi:uncharacterized protein (TIRG00374 family)